MTPNPVAKPEVPDAEMDANQGLPDDALPPLPSDQQQEGKLVLDHLLFMNGGPKESGIQDIVQKDIKKYLNELENEYRFRWILNQDDLKDEGAILGKAQALYQDKVDAIKHFFKMLETKARSISNHITEEITAIDLALKDNKSKLDATELAIENLATRPVLQSRNDNPYNIKGKLAPLISTAFALFGGYYAFIFWIFPDAGGLGWHIFNGVIATVIIMGGSYISNRSKSYMLHHNDRVLSKTEHTPEFWKLGIQEIGIPILVALVVIAFGWRMAPIEISIAIFLVLAPVMLFVGQSFFQSKVQAKEDANINALLEQEIKDWETKSSKLLGNLETYKAEEISLKNQQKAWRSMQRSVRSAEIINEESENHVKTFMSEYHLASKLTDLQQAKGMEPSWTASVHL